VSKPQSVIYVNFAQYDNAGRILDFLLENFEVTTHFSFDHLRLKNGKKFNSLHVYKNNRLVENKKLMSIRTPPFLLYPSLPLVAILILFQTLFYTLKLRIRYGKFDVFFTVNAFTAFIGILLKKLKFCERTVFWVWDYFPIEYPDWRIRLARWIYWKFDKPSMLWSDRVAFTNRRLLALRIKTGFLNGNKKFIIVPIGTNIKKIKEIKTRNLIIGFLGMLKFSQGLDLLLDNLEGVLSKFPGIKIEIIGSGPEKERFKKKAKKNAKSIKFYSFLEDGNLVNKLIERWTIGLATYIPTKSNESYWGDPSKIKVYLSMGVPVITTNVSYFAKEIKKNNAGVIIDYFNPQEFIKAITKILKKKEYFSKNAYMLAQKYNYKMLYPSLFKSLF